MAIDLLKDFRKIRVDFQESVTYYPLTGAAFGGFFGSGYFPKVYFPAVYFGNGGIAAPLPRVINAIVDRNPIAPTPAGSDSPVLHVWVDNDDTTGISSAEIDRGGDRLEVAQVIGKTKVQRVINRILRQTLGWLQLEVR